MATTRKPQQRAEAERRWPVVIGIAVALAMYALLPTTFLPALRIGVVVVSAGILIALIFLNPARFQRETRWSRVLSGAQSLLLLAANQVALAQLIIQLIQAKHADGPLILLAALQVWVTNVIAFSVLYWELDRGGPVARRRDQRSELPRADFRFPQDEDHDAIDEVRAGSSSRSDWMPGYLDYLYFSATNSMAFSPTDTMPLSSRAKGLMLLESFTGFVILALVIARAVSLLGG
ncbi:hypothetical protein GCM10009840_24430 [Pseudolysinimonas kribbensis]|uniref:DUF1345 domain-containing protein n=1 Tax=Pseudolysinimonas kribbensis TaxID=433641 RepID=A0ABQ6KBA5_9MICO|nr:DUF1345 domain-containing protein [Pseudolysinimonas kribbensis]GMA96785.1 hypothetical protein GCM10025881_36090 [Pseudolysinimonas kribbensis]